jgi:hypothetical protein
MTDEHIQELILQFLDERGGYVAAASERELFLLIKHVVFHCERDTVNRCVDIARTAGEQQGMATRRDVAFDIAAALRALVEG